MGSRAIHFWFPDFRRGGDESADWDWLSASECDQPWRMENDDVHEVFVDERIGGWHWGNPIATPDELYTLKLSHGAFIVNGSDANWNKHFYDLIFLERKGCQLIPELHDLLYPIWKEVHGRRKAKLAGQTKQGFFSDAVFRKYDHDSLHASVALRGRPMYESVLKDGSEVDCSLEKFQALDHEDKLILCFEEIAVTALERILIPAWERGESPQARRAYHWALRRVCTSLFKNEWALFVLQNASSLLVPMIDYEAWHKSHADRLVLL